MNKILERIKGSKKLENQKNHKSAHVVEMKDNSKPGAVTNVNISQGTTVKDLKLQLGYRAEDDLIRGKDRQTLGNKMDLYSTIEPDEKLIIVPDTEMGN